MPRTDYAANVMAVTPKASWGWVKAMLHSVDDQPDVDAVSAQFDWVVETLTAKFPAVAAQLEEARSDLLAFTAFAKEVWRQICPTTPPSGSTGRSADAPTSSASSCVLLLAVAAR